MGEVCWASDRPSVLQQLTDDKVFAQTLLKERRAGGGSALSCVSVFVSRRREICHVEPWCRAPRRAASSEERISYQSTGIRHFLQSSFRRASVADFHLFFCSIWKKTWNWNLDVKRLKKKKSLEPHGQNLFSPFIEKII